MRGNRRRDTGPELALRKLLHAQGLRYRVDAPVRTARRLVRPDVVFTRRRLAVFVDGCFWHGCPEHGVVPKSSTEWWTKKLEANRNRDRDTDAVLYRAGWRVLRFWEHEDLSSAADRVRRCLMPVADFLSASGTGPGDRYLLALGTVVWHVSMLEGRVIKDLQELGLGADVVRGCESATTGGMAHLLEAACAPMDDGPAKWYLLAAADHLAHVARLRNDVLHSRPEVHPEEGLRLSRFERVGMDITGRKFLIDSDWIEKTEWEIGNRVWHLSRLRHKVPILAGCQAGP